MRMWFLPILNGHEKFAVHSIAQNAAEMLKMQYSMSQTVEQIWGKNDAYLTLTFTGAVINLRDLILSIFSEGGITPSPDMAAPLQ